jgi:Holliday junction resolvase RusA-like endonuclease
MKYQFTVWGEPKTKARARVIKKDSKVFSYTPANTKQYENLILLSSLDKKPIKPLAGNIKLTWKVYKPIPKSFSQKKRERAKKGLIRPGVKPDLDNYLKCKDALSKVFWLDDSQIVEIHAYKYYSENPRLEIEIEEINENSEN